MNFQVVITVLGKVTANRDGAESMDCQLILDRNSSQMTEHRNRMGNIWKIIPAVIIRNDVVKDIRTTFNIRSEVDVGKRVLFKVGKRSHA